MKYRNKSNFKIMLDALCLLLVSFFTGEAGADPTSKDINAIITNSADNPVLVDILNGVKVDNPTFSPADIIETTILANGVVVISEAQIIREIIFVPDPSATTASACTGRIYAEDHPISMVRYPADHPVSMQGPVPVPIKVDQGATFFAKLEAPVGDNGSCSAEIVTYGTRYVPPPQ